jgi:hypothetical protein
MQGRMNFFSQISVDRRGFHVIKNGYERVSGKQILIEEVSYGVDGLSRFSVERHLGRH